ncbi:hypothetical protein VNO77_39170 [Canavalia gladiata]|uniref:Uncharacterized protein n=1 Tax=Canavalia gladiata TaxID=3824 RepID=A0AAN9KCX7_CANGL
MAFVIEAFMWTSKQRSLRYTHKIWINGTLLCGVWINLEPESLQMLGIEYQVMSDGEEAYPLVEVALPSHA